MSDEDTILPTGPINPVIFMNMNDLLDNVKEMWIAMTPYYIKSLYDGLNLHNIGHCYFKHYYKRLKFRFWFLFERARYRLDIQDNTHIF